MNAVEVGRIWHLKPYTNRISYEWIFQKHLVRHVAIKS